MVNKINVREVKGFFVSIVCLVTLTGCPGPGDRMYFDETAIVSKEGANVCMNITEAQDYQPVYMGINLRGTPSKEKYYNFHRALWLIMESCASPSLFISFRIKDSS